MPRPEPLMSSQAYKTFSTRSPLTTHFRKATCAEVQCAGYVNGWTFSVTALKLDPQLDYLARHSGKRFREVDGTPNGLEGLYLVYEPGQTCFDIDSHVTALERPAFYYVGRGDNRTFSTRRALQHSRAEDWVDDMSNHLDKIRTEIEKG
jgi:hypothetical protein